MPPGDRDAAKSSGACSISSSGTAHSSTTKACRHCRRHPDDTRRPMRILWLKSDLLLPLDKGGRIRTWHLLRHLALRHDITYLSFAEPGRTPAERDGMRQVAAHLETVSRSDP